MLNSYHTYNLYNVVKFSNSYESLVKLLFLNKIKAVMDNNILIYKKYL